MTKALVMTMLHICTARTIIGRMQSSKKISCVPNPIVAMVSKLNTKASWKLLRPMLQLNTLAIM